MADEDLVIDIPADDVEGAVITQEKPKTEGKKEVDPGEADLRSQLEALTATQKATDEARRRAEDEARREREAATKARDEAEKARTEAVGSQAETIESGIAEAQAQAEGAQRDLVAAYESGDFTKVGEAQRKIARAEARILRLEEGKADIEARRTETATRTKTETKPTDQNGDPVERYISQFSPRSQNWLREHKDAVTDPKKNLRMIAAHNDALAEDHVPDTDAYFRFLEERLGYAETEQEARPKPKSTTQRSRPMPAAPARDGASASPSNGQLKSTQVVLTPGEQRAATDGTLRWNRDDPKVGAVKGQPIGLKEFARRKSELMKNDRYNRIYTES